MEEIPVEELVKKGAMVKSPTLMTPTERAAWEVQVVEKARAHLFSIGQPMVYKKDGRMIAEHGDGRVEFLD